MISTSRSRPDQSLTVRLFRPLTAGMVPLSYSKRLALLSKFCLVVRITRPLFTFACRMPEASLRRHGP